MKLDNGNGQYNLQEQIMWLNAFETNELAVEYCEINGYMVKENNFLLKTLIIFFNHIAVNFTIFYSNSLVSKAFNHISVPANCTAHCHCPVSFV